MADGELRVPGTDRTVPLYWILLAVGIALDVIGTVWLLQGINFIPSGFMAGQMFWAYTGGIVMIAGMVVTAFAMRHKAEHG
jgi:biotin transporter BioY